MRSAPDRLRFCSLRLAFFRAPIARLARRLRLLRPCRPASGSTRFVLLFIRVLLRFVLALMVELDSTIVQLIKLSFIVARVVRIVGDVVVVSKASFEIGNLDLEHVIVGVIVRALE